MQGRMALTLGAAGSEDVACVVHRPVDKPRIAVNQLRRPCKRVLAVGAEDQPSIHSGEGSSDSTAFTVAIHVVQPQVRHIISHRWCDEAHHHHRPSPGGKVRHPLRTISSRQASHVCCFSEGLRLRTRRQSRPSTNATEPFGMHSRVGPDDSDWRRSSTASPVSSCPVGNPHATSKSGKMYALHVCAGCGRTGLGGGSGHVDM